MDANTRVERALNAALAYAESGHPPPGLADAMRYAVFPGGAQVRPRLCLAVARACGDTDLTLAEASAAAVELMHCASLVHDDLPCFDDADARRGKPSVHRLFGERLAVLAGDAMIVLAFQHMARMGACAPDRLANLILTLGRAIGMPGGIVAGQAWECEPAIDTEEYQRCKTGALFAGAAELGAASAGKDTGPWRRMGELLGACYQVADDICDAAGDAEVVGKPVGQDTALDRPSMVRDFGLEGAIAHFRDLVDQCAEAVPECPGRSSLQSLLRIEAARLIPEKLREVAA
jgi:geranylgeranyl diphosphate synthase type II